MTGRKEYRRSGYFSAVIMSGNKTDAAVKSEIPKQAAGNLA
ncbi:MULTISPECIES: hypothetical protein [unclassified Eisenbergiella]|jgi:hypothetical protein|nr:MULTISPECIES: hypothetical protein [unclassified Eisenbergiella]BDF46138.1 hypothetical protein CE91St56_32610 [Lachnospiraceae bacterium]GKH42208.1 hypothetical protein CE91St57_31820 [Lachnospiraceae bacterium]